MMQNGSPTVCASRSARPFCVRVFDEGEIQGAALDAPQRLDAGCFFDMRALGAWSHTFLPGKGWNRPLVVLAVRAAYEEPLGFVAFATQSIAGFRIAALAGYYWPFRTIAINADDSAYRELTDAVAESLSRHSPSAVLRLGPVSSNDRAVASLISDLLSRGWRGLRHEGGAVFELELPGDGDKLEETASPSLLKNIAYVRRRLTRQHGELRVVRHVLGADSGATLATLEGIEARSWVAGADTKFIGEANRLHWQALGAAVDRACDVVFWILYCGEHPVAFSVHFETPGVIYIIANSFDDGWKAHSPGSVLTLEVLRDAIRRGKRRVDWGQGDSGYKGRWGATPSSALFDVMLFKPGPVGLVLYAAARRKLRDWQAMDG